MSLSLALSVLVLFLCLILVSCLFVFDSCLVTREDEFETARLSCTVSVEETPPKNGVITLWPNTRVVKCKYSVSQKQIGFNNKIHWYSSVLTFVFEFTARL